MRQNALVVPDMRATAAERDATDFMVATECGRKRSCGELRSI
jgi:predicted TIM-barrel enzyme